MVLLRSAGWSCALLYLTGCALPLMGAEPPRAPHADSPTPTQRGRRASADPPRPPRPAATTAAPAAPASRAAPARRPEDDVGARLPRNAKACYDQLWHAGVTFELVGRNDAHGVEMPVRVTSAIAGVAIENRGKRRVHEIIDCRLALSLLRWAPALHAAGVVAIEHYSVYRPGARTRRGRRSGHANGLAIDVAAYRMYDGSEVEVLTDWEERERDEAPCPRRPHEAWGSRVLRGTVCEAVDRGLFSVVLTPHHDDAHQNHVHLEVKVGTDWTYVK